MYDINTEHGQNSDISFAPLEGLIAVTQSSTTWALHNFLSKEKLIERQEAAGVSSIAIHPDGLILAVGLRSGHV